MRKGLALLFGIAVVLALTVSSEGFSSTTTDRGVTVETVGDEDAYLSLEYPNSTQTADSGDTVVFLTVSNYFSNPVDVTVDYTVDGGPVADPSADSQSERLGVGDSIDVSTTVECDSGTATRVVSFDVRAEGSGTTAGTTEKRTVEYTVDCPTPTPTSTDTPGTDTSTP